MQQPQSSSNTTAAQQPLVVVPATPTTTVSVAPSSSIAGPKEGQDSRNIYVSHLPQSVDARYFRELFEPFGTVTNARLLLDVGTGFSRGIGFVMYEDHSAAQEAVTKMNKTQVHGGTIQVRFADCKHEESIAVATKYLLIRNIPSSVDKETVRNHFASLSGGVALAAIEFHPQSAVYGGPCPYNVAMVSYETTKEAENALNCVDGKMVFPAADPHHPRILAKYITDVAKEKKKSVLVPSHRGPTPMQGPATAIVGPRLLPSPQVLPFQQPPQPQQVTTYTTTTYSTVPPPSQAPPTMMGAGAPVIAAQPTTVHVYQHAPSPAGTVVQQPGTTHVYHQGPPPAPHGGFPPQPPPQALHPQPQMQTVQYTTTTTNPSTAGPLAQPQQLSQPVVMMSNDSHMIPGGGVPHPQNTAATTVKVVTHMVPGAPQPAPQPGHSVSSYGPPPPSAPPSSVYPAGPSSWQ